MGHDRTLDKRTSAPPQSRSRRSRPARTFAARSPFDAAETVSVAGRQTAPQLVEPPSAEQILNKATRAFGMNLSDVRIYRNSPIARDLAAAALALGRSVHIAPGFWAPETPIGQEVLHHELAHICQQRAGLVSPTAHRGSIPINDDETLERDAERAAKRAVRGQTTVMPASRSGPATDVASPVAQLMRLEDMKIDHTYQLRNRPGAWKLTAINADGTCMFDNELIASAEDAVQEWVEEKSRLDSETAAREEDDIGLDLMNIDHENELLLGREQPAAAFAPTNTARDFADAADFPLPAGQRQSQRPHQSPSQYAQTTPELFRAIRTTANTKKSVRDDGTGPIIADPDGDLFAKSDAEIRRARYRALAEWPQETTIRAADPEADVPVVAQVSGGNRATQYISTSKEWRRAAYATVYDWNTNDGTGDKLPRIRRPSAWAPVIVIDVQKLPESVKIYDLTDQGAHSDQLWSERIRGEPLDPGALQPVRDLARTDAEVLLAGEIPGRAVSRVYPVSKVVAELFRSDESFRRDFNVALSDHWSDSEKQLLEHFNILGSTPPPAVVERDGAVSEWVPRKRRRADTTKEEVATGGESEVEIAKRIQQKQQRRRRGGGRR